MLWTAGFIYLPFTQPDRRFHYSVASKSSVDQFYVVQKTLIDGFWGSEPVKCAVGLRGWIEHAVNRNWIFYISVSQRKLLLANPTRKCVGWLGSSTNGLLCLSLISWPLLDPPTTVLYVCQIKKPGCMDWNETWPRFGRCSRSRKIWAKRDWFPWVSFTCSVKKMPWFLEKYVAVFYYY